ncbi:hypothetical protein MHYP_G00246930 [Metynnis hypsauchen]
MEPVLQCSSTVSLAGLQNALSSNTVPPRCACLITVSTVCSEKFEVYPVQQLLQGRQHHRDKQSPPRSNTHTPCQCSATANLSTRDTGSCVPPFLSSVNPSIPLRGVNQWIDRLWRNRSDRDE